MDKQGKNVRDGGGMGGGQLKVLDIYTGVEGGADHGARDV